MPTPTPPHRSHARPDARGRVKRDSLRPEDALLSPLHRPPSAPLLDRTTNSSMYQQTRHESLTGVGSRRRTPRQVQYTQSAPMLPMPVVYYNSQLGSIEEEDKPSASPVTLPLPLPLPPPQLLQDAALAAVKIKEAVKKVYRPVDWRKLPQPIFECVLNKLRVLHTSRQSTGCTTCYMRDLCSMQMTCKSWFSEAQKRLYSSISIVGDDSQDKLRKYKLKHGARLMLLRRTLRAKSLLAGLVQELRVPDPIIPLYRPNGDPNPEYDDYICLLASLVMACPNLEVLDGFHSFYNHTFDRLTHALSTRHKLKQHTWVIAENADCTARSQKQLPPGIMDEHQIYQFLHYHDRWTQLETLLLCSPGSLGVLEHDVFAQALHSLPKLKHLCVSSFDADDFHDSTLQALPHLVSLRLEECPGVSDAGLMRWSASPNSVLIERLSLVHQNLMNLVTIARVLSNLECLRKFTLIQSDVEPSLPLATVVFQPFFASKTLEFLHWDIATASNDCSGPLSLHDALCSHPDGPSPTRSPNSYLALSILHHGFPSLTRVRAPRDVNPPGAIQSVCRPAKNMSMLLPHDRIALEFNPMKKEGNHLQAARIRAQRLIDRAVTEGGHGVKVLVTDHSNTSLSDASLNAHDAVVESPVSVTRTNSSSSSSRSNSRSNSSTEVTDDHDPSIAYGVSEELAMKERYLVGQDWDKEVVVCSRQQQQQLPSSPSPSTSTSTSTQRNRPMSSQPQRPPMATLHHRHDSAPAAAPTIRNPASAPSKRPHPPLRSSRTRGQELGTGPGVLKHAHTMAGTGRGAAQALAESSSPLHVHEFSLPTFVGRVNIHISASGQVFAPPRFWAVPDVPGREGNGGVVGWGELLLVQKRRGRGHGTGARGGKRGSVGERPGREQLSQGGEGGGGGGYCEGFWNRREEQEKEKEYKKGWTLGMSRRGEEKWKHTARERGWMGEAIDAGLLF